MQSGFERGVNGINRAGPRKAESAPDTLFLDWNAWDTGEPMAVEAVLELS